MQCYTYLRNVTDLLSDGKTPRNWKHQWLPLCLVRQARHVSMERSGAKLMISNQNFRVSWKPVNPQDCVWETLYRIIMKTMLQEKETIHCNIKSWYTKFIPMPQAMKIIAAKATGETGKDSSVGHNISQKQI